MVKQALVDGQLTPATSDIVIEGDAPSVATCPGCGHPVDLRRRGQTWFWRHQTGAPRDCLTRSRGWSPSPPPNPTPEQISELVALARRIGVEVVTLEAGQTVEVTGDDAPGATLVLAMRAGGQ